MEIEFLLLKLKFQNEETTNLKIEQPSDFKCAYAF